MMLPAYQDDAVTLYHGDALRLLMQLPAASIDAIFTDPPYSSGGAFRSDRGGATSTKYVLNGTDRVYHEFFGDNRDQRSWTQWCHLWLAESFRVAKPGCPLVCFVDWRQLPALTDAIQGAGWSWRGIVPWDKTEASRPQKGWFRNQCEYMVTASKGTLGMEQSRSGPCMPGIYRGQIKSSEKEHMTAKPLELMKWLCQILQPGSLILDPFGGSMTTMRAAKDCGMRGISCEMSEDILRDAIPRMAQEVLAL